MGPAEKTALLLRYILTVPLPLSCFSDKTSSWGQPGMFNTQVSDSA